MTFWQSVLLGLVQGITEFLPISSSGHFVVFRQLFHANMQAGDLYRAMLQLGAFISICLAFYKEIGRIILEGLGIVIDSLRNIMFFFKNMWNRKEKAVYIKIIKTSYRKLILLILVSAIPTGIIGYCGSWIFETAGNGLLVSGVCFIITALVLLICDESNGGRKTPKEIPYISAFRIGMIQGISMIPGLSRLGITMTAGMLYGFDKKFAVKYSFIMTIPMLFGAMIGSLKDIGSVVVVPSEIAGYVAGMLIMIVSGYICLKITVLLVKSKKIKVFSIYCFAMGILSIYGHFYII